MLSGFSATGASAAGDSDHSMFHIGALGGYGLYDIVVGGPRFGVTGGFSPIRHLEFAPTFSYNMGSFSASGASITGSTMQVMMDIRFRASGYGGFYIGANIGYLISSLTLTGSYSGLSIAAGAIPSHLIYGLGLGYDIAFVRHFSAGFDINAFMGGLLPTAQSALTLKFWF